MRESCEVGRAMPLSCCLETHHEELLGAPHPARANVITLGPKQGVLGADFLSLGKIDRTAWNVLERRVVL
jgi:hypothetical protein